MLAFTPVICSQSWSSLSSLVSQHHYSWALSHPAQWACPSLVQVQVLWTCASLSILQGSLRSEHWELCIHTGRQQLGNWCREYNAGENPLSHCLLLLPFPLSFHGAISVFPAFFLSFFTCIKVTIKPCRSVSLVIVHGKRQSAYTAEVNISVYL